MMHSTCASALQFVHRTPLSPVTNALLLLSAVTTGVERLHRSARSGVRGSVGVVIAPTPRNMPVPRL